MLRELKTNPHQVVAVKLITDNEVVYMESDKGNVLEVDSDSLRLNNRYSNGSFVTDTNQVGYIKNVWIATQTDLD